MPANTQPYKARSLSRDLFDKGMAYLEAAKQENFPPETLGVWFDQMSRLGWSEQKFRERVLAVLQAPTFGRISFDMFLSAESVPTKKPQSFCVIHSLRYDDHCPKCWSEKPVPIPEDVKEAIKKLEDKMQIKHCRKHKRDYSDVCPRCHEEAAELLKRERK